MRRLRYLSPREDADYEDMVGNAIEAVAGGDNGSRIGLLPPVTYSKARSLNITFKDVATGVWWVPPMRGISQQTGLMWLEGELHLPREMKATNNCPLFSIEVGNVFMCQCPIEFS